LSKRRKVVVDETDWGMEELAAAAMLEEMEEALEQQKRDSSRRDKPTQTPRMSRSFVKTLSES